MTKLAPSSTIALAMALLSPATAFAADAADADAGIPEIVVTAERRQQSAQDVSVALTVLGGADLAARGVTNVNQLQFQTPSLEVVPAFGGGQPQFRLRGVGFEDYATNNTPTVGVYIDEVAYPVPVMTQSAAFDIERVEVLRGPQGTLYGRNTTGGAINFISRKPTDRFSAGIDAEYGRFGQAKAEGYVSGPLGDTLKFRVSGITEQGGGFQRNRVTGEKLGDADRLFGRTILEWTPADRATITFNVHGGRDKSEQTGLYLFQPFQTRGYGLTGAPGPIIPADPTSGRLTGWGLSSTFAALAGYDVTDKPNRDNKSVGGSITAAIDLTDAVRLTSISAYDHFKRRELADWDASASHESDVFWGSKIDVYSQELRLSSIGDRRVNWVGGAYYSKQKLTESFLTDFTDSLGFITNTSYRQTAQSISAFGQINYKLSDQVAVIAGARYEHETRKLRDFSTAIGATPTFTNGNRDTKLNELSGKIGVEFKPSSRTMFYANASRGVKSGGFTVYNSPLADQIDAFKPEVVYAYEAGFKSDLAKSVRLNGAIFYYDYRNQQVLGTVLSQQYGLIGRITNAPKSEIYGGELELTLQPTPRFHITQSIGYKFGKYKTFDDIDPTTLVQDPATKLYSVSTVSKAGERIPIAHWSYGGSASYVFPLGGYELEAQADYSYRSKLPSFLGATYDLKERWLANATLTFRPEGGAWWIGAYGRNVFGTDYDLTRNYFLPFAKIASPGRPASYGVRAGFHL